MVHIMIGVIVVVAVVPAPQDPLHVPTPETAANVAGALKFEYSAAIQSAERITLSNLE
jgi:hypothetical protein